MSATSSARGRSGAIIPDRRAKAITSVAMFYDLEDPAAFVRDVAECLAEDGVWVMELHYLPTMLETNAFDVIVHEHLEYYSLAVIERLLAQAGLSATAAELNEVNGGSIRLFISHAGRRTAATEATARLQELRVREFEMALDSPAPYESFSTNVERIRRELKDFCESVTAEGKTIHIYGASTKGNTILQSAGLDRRLIPYAADRNPDKWGSKTIATEHPDHQRGGVSGDEAGLLPRAALALPRRVPRARARLPRGLGALRRAPSRGASDRRRAVLDGLRPSGLAGAGGGIRTL